MKQLALALLMMAAPAGAQIFPAKIKDKDDFRNFHYLYELLSKLNVGSPSGPYILKTDTFGGDVSGTYSAIAVTDDSHAHTPATLSGVITSTAAIKAQIDQIASSTGTLWVSMSTTSAHIYALDTTTQTFQLFLTTATAWFLDPLAAAASTAAYKPANNVFTGRNQFEGKVNFKDAVSLVSGSSLTIYDQGIGIVSTPAGQTVVTLAPTGIIYASNEINTSTMNALQFYGAFSRIDTNLTTAAYVNISNTFHSTNTFSQTITAPNYRILDSVVLSTTGGDYSTSVGVLAGDNSSGIANTYLGNSAGRWQSSGIYNTLIGYNAGYGPALALPYSSNTIIGAQAGNNLTYGSNNILIGYGVLTPLPATDSYLNIGNILVADMANSSATINGGLWVTSVTANDYKINDAVLGATTFYTVHDWMDMTQSGGLVSGGEITDAGDGSVNVSAGIGLIKTQDSTMGDTRFMRFNAKNQVLEDGVESWIYVDHNGGDPHISSTTDRTSVRQTDQFILGRVWRDGTDCDIISGGIRIDNFVRRNHERLILRGIERMSGASISAGVSVTSAIASTDGVFYLGNLQIQTPDANTENVGLVSSTTYRLYHRNGANWTKISNLKTLGAFYDTGTSTAAVGVAKYADIWVYVCMEGDLYIQYGITSGQSLAQAQAALPPSSIPPYLVSNAVLAAKIILKQGDTTFTSIQSAFVTKFTASVVNNHNDLSGIQGGTAGEYYHWTSSEYAGRITSTAAIVASTAPIFYIAQDTGTLWSSMSTTTARIDNLVSAVGYALTTSTQFAGDISGVYTAIAVGSDTHNHSMASLEGVLSSSTTVPGSLINLSTYTFGSDLTGVAYSSGVIPSTAIYTSGGAYPLSVYKATYPFIAPNTTDNNPNSVIFSADTGDYYQIRGDKNTLYYTPNTGVLSATAFSGSGANLTGVITSTAAIMSQLNAATTGISTAATLSSANTFTTGQIINADGPSQAVLNFQSNSSLYFSIGAESTMGAGYGAFVKADGKNISYKALEHNFTNGEVIASSMTVNGSLTASTATVTGSAFSVGGSTLQVANGSVYIGTNTTPGTNILLVTSRVAVPVKMVKYIPAANSPSAVLQLVGASTVDMVDGHGSGLQFSIEDNGVATTNIGTIYGIRDGADNSGAINFRTANAGSVAERMRISAAGNVGIGTTMPNNVLQVINLLNSDTTNQNMFLGHGAKTTVTGDFNTAFGNYPVSQLSTGNNNTAVGYQALYYNVGGDGNTAVGFRALVGTTGAYNTAIGDGAGGNITSGSSNIIIGCGISAPSATGSNQLNIGNTIYGNLSNGNVGIGETNPTSQLYVSSWTSSLGYIDRTDYPDTLAIAYSAVKSMGKKANGKGLDHAKMTDFVRKEAKRKVFNEVTKSTDTIIEYGRNLTGTVSAQNEVIKDLIKRIEALEKK